jgi:hypothetical protein
MRTASASSCSFGRIGKAHRAARLFKVIRAALLGDKPHGRGGIRLAYQAVECPLAGLGHWLVRHSQSGEWTAGFDGLLFGLKRREQLLG